MKIEKGKLYYDALCREIFKVDEDSSSNYNVSDKIAVVCKDDLDWQYVKKQLPHLRICDNMIHNAQKWDGDVLISLDGEGGYCSRKYYEKEGYHIITIDQFKEFYPKEPKELSLPMVDNSNIDNIIEALKIQTQLDYSIEAIERELSRLKELKKK